MFISPVSSNSYKRLESYKKQVQEGTSEQPGQLGSTKDLPVGFDKGQFVKSDNGSGLLSSGSNIWEELSVAGVENFNFIKISRYCNAPTLPLLRPRQQLQPQSYSL